MENNLNEEYDFVILGTGPAGLAACQYSARSGLSTLAVDTTVPGGQVLTIPKLENYPGVFPAVNGFELIGKMKEQAESFGARLIQEQVQSIDKIGSLFSIALSEKKIKAKAVLVSTGAGHRRLEIPGEKELEGRGVSYCATCDGPFFRNKVIAVVGGGDSACDEAMYLATLTDKVILIHRRNELRAQKAVAERVLSNKNIEVHFNSACKKINGSQKVESVLLTDTVTGEESELKCDAVFIFAGMEPRTELVPMLKTDSAGYIITDEKMETSIPGLYAAGDVRAKPFRQIVTAVSDGAVAAFEAAEYIRKNF